MNEEEMAKRLAETMKNQVDSDILEKVAKEAKKVYDMNGNLVDGITYIYADVIDAKPRKLKASYTINEDDVDEEIYDSTFPDDTEYNPFKDNKK